MIKSIGKLLLATSLLATPVTAFASRSDMAPTRNVATGGAFYDDHYGPFYNGYWTEAGEYFFSTGPLRPYVRDDGRHFSRVMAAGYRPVEGFVPEAAAETTASR